MYLVGNPNSIRFTFALGPGLILFAVIFGSYDVAIYFPEQMLTTHEFLLLCLTAIIFASFMCYFSYLPIIKATHYAALSFSGTTVFFALSEKLPPLVGEVPVANIIKLTTVFIIIYLSCVTFRTVQALLTIFIIAFLSSGIAISLVSKQEQVLTSAQYSSQTPVFSKNKENIIVLIIDTAHAEIFNSALMREKIEGLRVFANYHSNFTSTFTSIPYLFSGISPSGKYYREFQNEFICNNIQAELIKNDWNVYNFPYRHLRSSFPLKECNTTKLISSSQKNSGVFNRLIFSVEVFLYKHNIGKIFGTLSSLNQSITEIEKNDDQLFDMLRRSEIGETTKNVFTFVHFNGLHQPIQKETADESYDDSYKRKANQIVSKISEFINNLKDQGVSKKTKIFILGDHGALLKSHPYPINGIVEDVGSDILFPSKYYKIDQGSEIGRRLVKIYGENLREDTFVSAVEAAGLDASFDEFYSSVVVTDYNQRQEFLSQIYSLSRASFALVDLSKSDIQIDETFVFSDLLRHLILGRIEFEGRDQFVYLTRFSGDISKDRIVHIGECKLTVEPFHCRILEGVSVSGSKKNMDPKQSTIRLTSPRSLDLGCPRIALQGANLYDAEDLLCIQERLTQHKIDSGKLLSKHVRAFGAHQESKDLVTLTGVKSILSVDKNKNIEIRFAAASPPQTNANYTIQYCSQKFFLGILDSVPFDLKMISDPNCRELLIYNSNTLNPFLDVGSEKDARFINSRIYGLVKHPETSLFSGIVYPKEGRDLRWIAGFPFRINALACDSKIKLHFFTSQSGNVSITSWKNNEKQFEETISGDVLIDFKKIFCSTDRTFDFIEFSAPVSGFRVEGDTRQLAAQIYDLD